MDLYCVISELSIISIAMQTQETQQFAKFFIKDIKNKLQDEKDQSSEVNQQISMNTALLE